MKYALVIAGLMGLVLPASASAQPNCFSDGVCTMPVPQFAPLKPQTLTPEQAAALAKRQGTKVYVPAPLPETPPPATPQPLPPPPPPPPPSYVTTRDAAGVVTIRSSNGDVTQARMEGNQLVVPGQVQPLATINPLPPTPGLQVSGITRNDGVRMVSSTDAAGNTMITGSDGSVIRCSTSSVETVCR